MPSLYDKLTEVAAGRVPANYLLPLFWQHGESKEVLSAEIRAMHDAGMAAFILEPRPYPGFLSESWFDIVAFALKEAAKYSMKVYVFDDSHFPSGYANGIIAEKYPQYLRRMLRMDYLDAIGPRSGVSLAVAAWKRFSEDQFFKIVAVKMTDQYNGLESQSGVDLTDRVVDGILYWDLPPGRWRICVFHQTREGGEEHTRNYLNLLDYDAVKCYIDLVYEPHYQHFKLEFGHTFMGFFSDEPRFGNAASYEATLGKMPMVIPFDDQLPARLNAAAGEDFGRLYPWLWFGSGDCARRARYIYMDTVSRLYSENIPCQIGAWCRKHGVEYLGHIVAGNGAHARLGYGNGHFFRALNGQSMGGVDTVLLQNVPEFTDGTFPTPFSPPLDARFFHWGLGKLGSSCGHLNPAMNGKAFCEIFGAYGWSEGLRMMKWMTDHFLVRGINRLIPHAFSPKNFPDPDCPPHFYAGGHNPQWRAFPVWSNYANTLCHLLSGGIHQATAAVLYHAEAEWTGDDYEPFECAVQALSKGNIDCDVVSKDMLDDAAVRDNRLQIARESFDALLIPYAQSWPEAVAVTLRRIAAAGVPLVWMRGKPLSLPGEVVQPCNLASYFFKKGWYDFKISPMLPDLRFYHYCFPDGEVYLFVNENLRKSLDGQITFRQIKPQLGYDPISGQWAEFSVSDQFPLHLTPAQSYLLFRGLEKRPETILFSNPVETMEEIPGPDIWEISTTTAEDYPNFTLFQSAGTIGNLALPGCLPFFSGTIRYKARIEVPHGKVVQLLDLGEVFEIAEVTIDGIPCGIRICPPYQFAVKLETGSHELQIDITNTLVRKYGGSIFDAGNLQNPSGLVGPISFFIF